jgi:hypothetical protein
MTTHDETHIQPDQQNTQEPPKKIRGILFTCISILSCIIFPLLLLVVILYQLFVAPDFYTSILKRSSLIKTFIEAYNVSIDQNIKKEINESVKLDDFVSEFNDVKGQSEKAFDYYKMLNRSDEYDDLKTRRKELSGLSWQYAPSSFKSKDEFEKYQENELARFDTRIEEIEKYRDDNEDAIDKAEDAMKVSEKELKKAQSTLEDKQDQADDIVKKYREASMSEIHEDIEVLGSRLTSILNEKLIDGTVRNKIETVINFLTSYYDQERDGKISVETFPYRPDYRKLTIAFPDMSFSMWIEEEVNGIMQKRHLLSQVLVDEIRRTGELKKKNTYINIFKLADTSLGEHFGNKYLSKFKLSIDNGIINLQLKNLEGDDAQRLEWVMLVLTWGAYLKFVLPGLLFMLFMYYFFSRVDRDRKLQSLQHMSIIPSAVIIFFSFAGFLTARYFISMRPDLIENIIVRVYAKTVMTSASLHVFFPCAASFGIIVCIGLIIRTTRKKHAMQTAVS